jgi:hypothetical protein
MPLLPRQLETVRFVAVELAISLMLPDVLVVDSTRLGLTTAQLLIVTLL